MNLSQIRVALDDAGGDRQKTGTEFPARPKPGALDCEQAQISRDDFVGKLGPGAWRPHKRDLKRVQRVCWRWRKMRGCRIFCAKNLATRDSKLHHGDALDSTSGFIRRNATSN